MSPDKFLDQILDPGLLALDALGGPNVSDAARRQLLAIAQQESGPGLNARYQGSPSTAAGPARGWWQFERDGGVAGVRTHKRTAELVAKCCAHYEVVNANAAVWRALEGHDLLAVAFARLLLLTDPEPLPLNEAAGWDCYLKLWRPGKPHPRVWADNWRIAAAAVRIAEV